MGQTDLDKLVGGEPEDVTKKGPQSGMPRDPADAVPQDDKLPIRAMPKVDTPTPFKITGGGSGQ